jgi:cytochrome c5
MKLMPVKTAQWLSITCLSAVAAFAAVQQAPNLPDGEGKDLINAACITCHGNEVYANKQLNKEEWLAVATRMQAYGASVDAKQSETIAAYLAQHFGPKADATKPAETKPGSEANPAANDAETKKMVESSCGGCHGFDLITNRTGTKAEWQEIVDRMIGRGASLADKDIPAVVDYLARTYAPK